MPIEVSSAAARGGNIHESAKSRIADSSAQSRGLADKDEIQKGQSAAGDAGSNLSDGLIQDRKVTVWNRTDFPIQASINASFSGGGNPEKFTIAPGGYEEWHRSSSPVGHYALHYFNAAGDELGTVRFGIGNNDREFDFTPQSAVATDGDDLLDGLIEDRKVTVCNRTDFPIQASINASFSGGGNPEKFTIAPGASETWTRSPSPVGHYALHYFNAEGDELGTVRFGIGISDREFDFEFKAQSAVGADRNIAAEGVVDSDLFDGLIQDHKVTVMNRTANLIQASINASFSGGGGNTFKFTLAPGGSETWTRSLSPSGYYALRVYDTAGELLRTINFGIGKSDCEFEIV